MSSASFGNWHSLSDKALAQHLGRFVKHHRMEQTKTQDDLAAAAGISRSTLSLLERGETVTLATLLQVLRALDQLDVLDAFNIEETISPLDLARMEQAKRQRSRPPSATKGRSSNRKG